MKDCIKDLLLYRGYYGSVHFDKDNLVLKGKVEFVNVVLTYQVTDSTKIVNAFHKVVDDYLEDCRVKNILPEKCLGGSFSIRIGRELHRQVNLAANAYKISTNLFIKNILEKAIVDMQLEKILL